MILGFFSNTGKNYEVYKGLHIANVYISFQLWKNCDFFSRSVFAFLIINLVVKVYCVLIRQYLRIVMFKDLKILDFGSNRPMGPIPPEIGNLSGIMNCSLWNNSILLLFIHFIWPLFFGLILNLMDYLWKGNLRIEIQLWLDQKSIITLLELYLLKMDEVFLPIQMKWSCISLSAGICQLSQLKVADFSLNIWLEAYASD